VIASLDGTVRIFNVRTGELTREIKGIKGSVNSVSFSYCGRYVVTASCDGSACIFDLHTDKIVLTLSVDESSIVSASFSPCGEFVVTVSENGTIRRFRLIRQSGLSAAL
jgi:WD40 repeat protein